MTEPQLQEGNWPPELFQCPHCGRIFDGDDEGCCSMEAIILCGRLLVGQGSDTYDPMCTRSRGHEGVCRP